MEENQCLGGDHMYGDESMSVERGEEGAEKMTSTGNMSSGGSAMGAEQGD